MELTQEHVRELFNYNQETGVLTRKASSNNQMIRVGDEVGCLRTDGYREVKINGKSCKVHRIIFLWMTGEFPEVDIDHENRVRHDNKWKNLRSATRAENCQNQGVYKNNTSGHLGLSWNVRSEKWRVRLMVEGKSMHLGYFANKDDAIFCRKQANIKYNFHPNHGKSAGTK